MVQNRPCPDVSLKQHRPGEVKGHHGDAHASNQTLLRVLTNEAEGQTGMSSPVVREKTNSQLYFGAPSHGADFSCLNVKTSNYGKRSKHRKPETVRPGFKGSVMKSWTD